MSCTFAEPADSPIKADLSSADNSNQAIKSAVKRGSESAQHDIEKKTFRILYFGEPWSMGKPLVDDTTGFSKDDDLVGMMPVRHWTYSKIRCHVLTCIITLSYLRLVEIMLKRAGLPDVRRHGDGEHAPPAFLSIMGYWQRQADQND